MAGIILAAGRSTRMGGGINKMLLDLGGAPMVRRVVEHALAAGLEPVVVVTGHERERVLTALAGLAVAEVFNPDFVGAMSSSLHAGVRAVPQACEGAVVLLGDMPHVTRELIGAVRARASASRAALVVSRYDGVTAPPVYFARHLFAEVCAAKGEGVGRAVIQRHAAEAEYLDWPAAAMRDVDTPSDVGSISANGARGA